MIHCLRSWPARVLLACLLALAAPCVGAGEAPSLAEDPQLEARVMRLAEELRCLVCQNQTIAESHAGLAIDLKNQVREQLRAGRSNEDILSYMAERYGDFVLYRPPVKATTAALWYGPFALLAFAAAAAVFVVRRRGLAEPAAELADAQRQRAAALLADEPEARS